MDPNANLEEQEMIIVRNTGGDNWNPQRGDRTRLCELREALYEWLDGGGFQPDWTIGPHAARYFSATIDRLDRGGTCAIQTGV